jgi:hypothetical protein
VFQATAVQFWVNFQEQVNAHLFTYPANVDWKEAKSKNYHNNNQHLDHLE